MQAKLLPACKSSDLRRCHTDFIFTSPRVRGFKEDLLLDSSVCPVLDHSVTRCSAWSFKTSGHEDFITVPEQLLYLQFSQEVFVF